MKTLITCVSAIGFIVLLFAGLPAHGGEDRFAKKRWGVKCHIDGSEFDVMAISKSGFPDEDDMIVQLKTTGGKVYKLPLPEALYVPRGSVSNEKNLCEDYEGISTSAFRISDSKVILFLSKDNRPSLDELVLALVDVKSGVFYSMEDTGLAIKSAEGERLVVRKSEAGYKVRLATEYMKDTGTDSIENYIESWVGVAIDDKNTLAVLR